MILPPEVGEAVESQSLESENVLAGPHGSELHGNVAAVLSDGLVESLEVKCVLETFVVRKIVHAKEPYRVDGIAGCDAAIVFHMQAPSLESRFLPEVEAT